MSWYHKGCLTKGNRINAAEGEYRSNGSNKELPLRFSRDFHPSQCVIV